MNNRMDPLQGIIYYSILRHNRKKYLDMFKMIIYLCANWVLLVPTISLAVRDAVKRFDGNHMFHS